MTAMPDEMKVAALLGPFTEENLLLTPLEHVLALLPRPDDTEAPTVRAALTVRICLWHQAGAPKPDGHIGVEQVIGEMRNQSRFDSGGKSRKTSAYMGGVAAANAFEAEILAGSGLANRPSDLSFRCNVFLFEPRLWVLKKDWTNKEAKEAYDLCIIPGRGYADDGLMLFWQNRKTYVHALIEMYRFLLDGIPAESDPSAWTSAATAKMIAPMVANALLLLQLEFSTTVRKLCQLRVLGETSAEGPRPNMPFWLVDAMKADAKNADARRTARGRGGGDRGGRGGGSGGRGNRDTRDQREKDRNKGNKGDKANKGKPKRDRDDAKDDKSD